MVFALRLAHWREMVSRPPKKILSTATADPRDDGNSEIEERTRGKLTGNTQNVTSKAIEVWKLSLSTGPPANWITGIKIFMREFEVFF